MATYPEALRAVFAEEKAAKVESTRGFEELLHLLRSRSGVLASGWEAELGKDREGAVTREKDAITLARTRVISVDSGNGCGETDGYVAILRADGSVWGAATAGCFWSAHMGGEAWEIVGCLEPMGAVALAERFELELVLGALAALLERRKGEARCLRAVRQRINRALRGRS